MAEGIMKKRKEEEKLDIEIYSCGIFAQTGDFATNYAKEAVKKYDVDISSHRATNIKEAKLEEMDVILCATKSHKQNILFLYPYTKGKVFTMKEYAKLDNNGQDMDIQDPWGYDLKTYQSCAEEIKECIEKIIEKENK